MINALASKRSLKYKLLLRAPKGGKHLLYTLSQQRLSVSFIHLLVNH